MRPMPLLGLAADEHVRYTAEEEIVSKGKRRDARRILDYACAY